MFRDNYSPELEDRIKEDQLCNYLSEYDHLDDDVEDDEEEEEGEE